jgi:GTP-binding protein HflX
MRKLTGADVLVENKLFATLDPTTRRLYLPMGQEVLLIDTVGFIQKLPTALVKAFRATLEEVVQTDLLLHIWDMSHPDRMQHLKTVEETLEELGAAGLPLITVCNKIDEVPDWKQELEDLESQLVNPAPISAKNGEGIPELLTLIELRAKEIIRLGVH